VFEKLIRSFSNQIEIRCEKCGGEVEKLISVFAFSGSGDFKSSASTESHSCTSCHTHNCGTCK
jgi:predicted nucleic acid-binding Zn ribbon protein